MNGPMNPALQGRPMGVSSGAQPQPPHMGQGPQGHPNGLRAPQQMPFGTGQPNHAMSPPYGSPSNERHWYDKIVDVIVGEEGPDTKYALICGQCFAHNGLALPQEIEDIRKSSCSVVLLLDTFTKLTVIGTDFNQSMFIHYLIRIRVSKVQLFQPFAQKDTLGCCRNSLIAQPRLHLSSCRGEAIALFQRAFTRTFNGPFTSP